MLNTKIVVIKGGIIKMSKDIVGTHVLVNIKKSVLPVILQPFKPLNSVLV